MVDRHEFIWSVLATDVDFGPDGAFYVSDWVDGWDKPNKGRIYKVADPELAKDPAVQEVKKLLAEGFDKRSPEELVGLLGPQGHARAAGGAVRAGREGRRRRSRRSPASREGQANRLARLHAIWGLGQIGRKDAAAYKALLPLLNDADAEVRAQAAKVLGEGKVAEAGDSFIAC